MMPWTRARRAELLAHLVERDEELDERRSARSRRATATEA
jgi:hypothetical protein